MPKIESRVGKVVTFTTFKIFPAILVLLVTILLIYLKPVFFWKTLNIDGVYTLRMPSGWNSQHYSSAGNYSELTLSNYSGELAYQDRSSKQEMAKIDIVRLDKKAVDIDIDRQAQIIKGLFPESKSFKTVTMKNGLTAIKVVVDARIEYLIIDTDKYIYRVQRYVFEDVPELKARYYFFLTKKIVESINFQNQK